MFNYIIFVLALTGFWMGGYGGKDLTVFSPALGSDTLSKNSQNLVKKIYERRDSLKLCGGDTNAEIALNSSSVYSLDRGRYLVQFICFLGAYQGNYHYIFAADNNFKILSLDIIEGKKKTSTKEIVGLPTFNPKTKTLTVYNKYRGLGDCGSWAKYQWRGDGFQLLEYREKQKCDGKYIDPEKYPKLYP
ncbi:MAG: hypothetical protein N5P05_000330 [Chroococcopsis gigantea SAG 12.99]|jgi:hypothetical protein|nr:hypothetical protein [Chroococcopsis gigantea SAG 12.99]